MNNYNIEIIKSSRELSKREILRFTDTSAAESLNDLTKNGQELRLKPTGYADVMVHNPNAKPDPKNGEVRTDYPVFLIEDEDGNIYQTSSDAFREAFTRIWSVMMEDDNPESFEIDVIRKQSSNYNGTFITCAIV